MLEVEDLKETVDFYEYGAKVLVSIFDENREEQLIDIKNISKGSEGIMVFDISEDIANILDNFEQKIFQRCLGNTPEELQTKETLQLLSKMFGYKINLNNG
jgi:hypothetical protein